VIEDYQAKRRRARVLQRGLLALGVFLALTSAVITYYFASRSPAVDDPVTVNTQVLVAKRDIPVRTVISAADVTAVQTNSAVVPAGSLREPGEAVGRVATQPIAMNEIIHSSRFTDSASTGFAIFPEGQQPSGTSPDFRAMSLNVPDAQAVGGTVRAGDRVDILFALVFAPLQFGTSALEQDFAARILAENVAVLAKDGGTIYTFRVEAAQAERIAAMQAAGATMHLLLRSGDDTRTPRASGAIYSSDAGRILRAIPTASPAPSPR
jgi:Flp pilus assembly protein CpaB